MDLRSFPPRLLLGLAFLALAAGGTCEVSYDSRHCEDPPCDPEEGRDGGAGGRPEADGAFRLTRFRLEPSRDPRLHPVARIHGIEGLPKAAAPGTALRAPRAEWFARRVLAANPDLLLLPDAAGLLLSGGLHPEPDGCRLLLLQAAAPGVLEYRFDPEGRLVEIRNRLIRLPALTAPW